MDKRTTGSVLLAVIFMAACHNVFKKDKPAPEGGTLQPKNDSTTVAVTVTDSVKTTDTLVHVYLTFDDGPEQGTLNCYRTCRDLGVKATFFMIGEHAYYPAGKKILDTMRTDLRHFLLANHSFTHAYHNQYQKFYHQPSVAVNDFFRVQDSLGFIFPIVRFPANNSWVLENRRRTTALTRPLAHLMDSLGFNVLGWDVEWRFGQGTVPVQSAEAIAKEVIDAVKNGETMVDDHVVLLAHDRMFRHSRYRDSLAKAITLLQSEKGYIFETAASFPLLKKGPPPSLVRN